MKNTRIAQRWTAGRLELALILLVAALHGLVYIFLMPPWQHHDEPKHFERVWLTANRGLRVEPQDHDPWLDQQVVRSMVDNGFYARSDYRPDPNDPEIRIGGYDQSGEKPLYYWLASLPVGLMKDAPIERQLLAGRFVSWFFFLVTIVAAWGFAGEVFTAENPLRWMLPLALALLPGFVDLMTAVNNDTAAVAAASLFLWCGVATLRRGLSLPRLIALGLTSVLVFLSKTTAWVVLPALPLMLLFGIVRGAQRRHAWAILGVGMVVGAAGLLRWDGASDWAYSTTQPAAVRQPTDQMVLGEWAFMVSMRYPRLPQYHYTIYQVIPPQQVRQLRGKTVTVGAWMWASEPVEAYSPRLDVIVRSHWQKVPLDQTPRFVAFHMEVPTEAVRGFLALDPYPDPAFKGRVYYEGVVMAEGTFPLDQTPYYYDPRGERGEWDGQPFQNLVRNASAEKAGLRLLPQLDQRLASFLPQNTRPNMVIASFQDWEATSEFYRNTAYFLVQTFWARLGWSHVTLLLPVAYLALLWLTLFGLLGAGIAWFRARREADHTLMLILLGIALLSWLSTLTRGVVTWGSAGGYLPAARHSFPVMVPTMSALLIGWKQWGSWLSRGSQLWLRGRRATEAAPSAAAIGGWITPAILRKLAFWLFFLSLDALAVLSAISYYQRYSA